MSLALAAWSAGALACKASAIASSAAFFSAVESRANSREAALACCASCVIWFSNDMERA